MIGLAVSTASVSFDTISPIIAIPRYFVSDVSNSLIGKENVVAVEPQMVGEDFARYGSTKEDIPTAMYWLGTVPKERMDRYISGEYALPALHSPFYYPDIENSIRTGVKVSTESLIKLFNN